jgi:YVTN family beta-propeller protein
MKPVRSVRREEKTDRRPRFPLLILFILLIPTILTNSLSMTNRVFASVSAVATTTSANQTTITVGGLPNGIAFDSQNGYLYVANFAPGTVSVIDGRENSVVATVNVNLPVSPWEVAFDPTNGNVYVSDNKNGAVSVIDGESNSLLATVAVGDDLLSGDHDDRPNYVVYNPNNQVMYVAMYASGYLAEINNVNQLFANSPLDYQAYVNRGAWGATYDSSNCNLYASNVLTNNVMVIDAITNSYITSVSVGRDPDGMAVDSVPGPGYGDVFVSNYAANTVSVISGASNAVAATINVGQNPDGIALDTRTGNLYVANFGDGTVSVIDGATDTVVNTVTVGSGPSGVAYDPWNDNIYVTNSNAGTVSVIPALNDSSTSSATTVQTSGSCDMASSSTSSSSVESTSTSNSSTHHTSSSSVTIVSSQTETNDDTSLNISSSFSSSTSSSAASHDDSTLGNSQIELVALGIISAIALVTGVAFVIRRRSASQI